MESTNQNSLNVVIVEDNVYYNKMLFYLIDTKLHSLSTKVNLFYELKSFYQFKDFEDNLNGKIDLAFVDFYLENDNTGLDVIYELKKNDYNCKVIIISDFKNKINMQKCLNAGASGIIFKDRNILSLCDFIIDEKVNNLRYGI